MTDDETMLKEFKENMKELLRKENLKHINDYDLVVIPIIQSIKSLLPNLIQPINILIDNSHYKKV